MSVKTFITGATVGLIVLILVFSVAHSTSPLLWFVDTSEVYTFLRLVIVAMLVGLLVTTPPRSKLLRSSFGALAMLLMAVVVSQVLAYQIHLIDVIIFTEVAIILGIEALEASYVRERPRVSRIDKAYQ